MGFPWPSVLFRWIHVQTGLVTGLLHSALPCEQGNEEYICFATGQQHLDLSTRDEQLDMLTRVLSAGENEAAVEADDVTDGIR